MGDLNINFKKFGSEFDNSRLYNIVCLCFLMPLILQTTRVPEKLKTLIDNIFLKSFDFSIVSGNIVHSIFDHLMQFFILEDFIKMDKYK